MSDRSSSSILAPRAASQSGRDERRRPRAGRGRGGSVGWLAGLSGLDLSSLAGGWALAVATAVIAAVVNALTLLADMPYMPRWQPWALEGSSNLVLALIGWLPGLAILLASPPHQARGVSRWTRLFAVHLAAVALFNALHVMGMMVLRQGLYAAAHVPYRYAPVGDRLVYEFRKDLFAYAIFAGAFLLVRRTIQKRDGAERVVSFDIRDGARLIRVPVGEILAVSSAGNYVEFVLADGRRPLMRATLTAIEDTLGLQGFVRIHRSWLINAARVIGLRPQRTGDWIIDLDGLSAPLSRRYRGALARLKRDGDPAA